jgi:hypothetical protein
MSKYEVKRPGHLGEIECIEEQPRVPDLPAAAAAHEAPKLLLGGPSLPRGLLLEGAERSEVSLRFGDLLHGARAQRADQLVLQVRDAHVETEPFHAGASQVGAEAGPLETALELAFLCGIAETRQPDVQPLRTEQIQEASDGLRTPHRHDGDALSLEIATTALRERFDRDLVATPLDEHDRTQVDACGGRAYCGSSRPFEVCRVESLPLVHIPYLHSSLHPSGLRCSG